MKSRIIRVFISSTFRDMNAERDYLITKVFPRLQVEAAKRDVIIIPLDLRWGVTEEESKTGKVIEICLQEIENSHPFFIGLIGERYGWCPSKSELLKNEILQERWGEWLEKDIAAGLSVTEIEMQYGVLRSKEPVNAYFYLKKKSEKSNFYKDFIAQLSRGDHDKLDRLKQQIRRNGRYPVFEYATPEELGQQVEQTFLKLLEKKFPDQALTKLEKERLAQKAFLHSRTATYIPTEKYFIALDTFANSYEHNYFVVVGESGMGKSALIANWLLHHKNNDNVVIYHSLSNGGMQADYKQILQYLHDEIVDIFHFSTAATVYEKDDNDLTKKLEDLFARIFEKGSVFIILDGINQLADIDDAKQLNWLPSPTKNIKLIFTTTLDDPTYDILKTKRCQELLLQPLNDDQRTQLIVDYLSRYRKKLLSEQVCKIAHHHICQNTHVLQTLLNELVAFGSHELLDKRIDYFLQVTSYEEFFRRVICRYEEDFGKTFCKQVLSLIAFSRQGLSELEIIKITQITPLQWSQFYCAFQSHISHRNDLLFYAHQQMYKAIIMCYAEEEMVVRKTIISEFKDYNNARAWEELAYQYYCSAFYESLYTLIGHINIFLYFYRNDLLSLGKYWQVLIDYNAQQYSPLIYMSFLEESTKECAALCQKIGFFMSEYVHGTEGAWYKYLEKALNHYHKMADLSQSINYSLEQADIYAYLAHQMPSRTDGQIENSHENLEKGKQLIDNIDINTLDKNKRRKVADFYYYAGCYYRHILSIEKAVENLKKAVYIGDNKWPRMSESQKELGIVYGILHQYDDCLYYTKLAIQTSINLYGKQHPKTALCYEMNAQSFARCNKIDEAVAKAKMAVDIYEIYYARESPNLAEAYDTLGGILKDKKSYSEAIDYLKKGLYTYTKVYGEKSIDVVISQKQIGETYIEMNLYSEALPYLQQAADNSLSLLVDHNRLNPWNNVHRREMERSVEIHVSLAKAYLSTGEDEKAMETLQKTLQSLFATATFHFPVYAEVYLMISSIYANRKIYWDANSSVSLMGAIKRTQLDAIHFAGEAVAIYDRLEYRNKVELPKTKEIRKRYYEVIDHAVAYYQEKLGSLTIDSTETISINKIIAKIYQGQHTLSGGWSKEYGNYKKAIDYYNIALKAEEDLLGVDHPDIADTTYSMGVVCNMNHDSAQALVYFNRAYAILVKHYGVEHKLTVLVKNVIENTQKRIR